MDYHDQALNELCRICGNLLKPGNWVCKIQDHSELFGTIFLISKDKEGIHPPKCCHKCYAVAASAKKKACSQVSTDPVVWKQHDNSSCDTCVHYWSKEAGGRPSKKVKRAGHPKKVESVSDIMNISSIKQVTPEVEKAVARVLKLKARESSPSLIRIQSGGSQPLTCTPVVVVRKESQDVTPRIVRSRTKNQKEIMDLMAGSSSEAVGKQTSHLVKQLDKDTRVSILQNFQHTVTVPQDDVASMKSTLGLSWNKMRDIHRWLGTFKVSLAPEGKVRATVKGWLKNCLQCEELPASFLKDKKLTVKLVPWCYIFNLVGYLLITMFLILLNISITAKLTNSK